MMLIKEPKALFGGPLLGSSLVRYIYIDEAGTSAKEPVSVVVGVIINADTQWRLAERELNNVFDRFVPSQFRENFVFHAKEIWGSPKYRDGWPIEKRLKFLRRVMKIPRNLRVPIALGIQRRGSIQGPPEMDHLMAFAMCVGRADLFLRKFCHEDEVATVIVEDSPTLRKEMKKVVRVAPKLILGAEHLEPTKMEKATRVRQQDGDLRISRVIDSVHFVEKRDGPLLQLADACAFGFRRYFSNQTHGADFVRSMLAKSLVAEDWAGGISGGLFVRNPNNFTAQMIPVWRA